MDDTPQTKIIHIDMDAFFVSVEMRDRPELKGHPVAVGGRPEQRGVIATANYEARTYGVHSAMSAHHAMQLCPHLLILFPDTAKYREESLALRAIFEQYCDAIEPLSFDEAFLDVTGSPYCRGSATWIAHTIRMQIQRERGLTASAGVAPNKFLAKVASDWNKPNGQFVIPPAAVPAFVKQLPIEKLWGVGKRTAQQLHDMGICTCEQLQQWPLIELQERLGSRAATLKELSQGIDRRTVQTDRTRKSISVEDTYPEDLQDLPACSDKLPELLERLMQRYKRTDPQPAIRKLFVKVKFRDFQQTTAEQHDLQTPDLESFETLLQIAWNRKREPVRLLGIGVILDTDRELQLTFW